MRESAAGQESKCEGGREALEKVPLRRHSAEPGGVARASLGTEPFRWRHHWEGDGAAQRAGG